MTVSPHLPKDAHWRDIVLQATAVEYIPAAAVVAVATQGHWPTYIEHRDWDLDAVRAYCHEAGIEFIHNDGALGQSILVGKEWHRRKLESGAA